MVFRLIEKMFATLFDKYINDLNREDGNSSIYTDFLNDMNYNYKQSNKKEKIVLDFIAGMTDDYFNKEYENYIMPKSYGLRIN